MQGRYKHNKYLIIQQSWAAIDNYMLNICCVYDGPTYLFLHCSRHTTGMSHLKKEIVIVFLRLYRHVSENAATIALDFHCPLATHKIVSCLVLHTQNACLQCMSDHNLAVCFTQIFLCLPFIPYFFHGKWMNLRPVLFSVITQQVVVIS